MAAPHLKNKKTGLAKSRYGQFSRIDGHHPLRENTSGSCVVYEVRTRRRGRLLHFNFDLAKEMGLIPGDHPKEINVELENSVLSAFALQIINEFDLANAVKISPEDLRAQTCVATRYLQLQHKDKLGLMSGDGRSLWNGVWEHRGQKWDITSCGTGATCLSPAYSKNREFIKTGDPYQSYGCGYAEVNDGLSNAIYSEIFHRSGIKTERTLAVIEFPGGYSINVRAGRNLIRPSHFFLHLRQGRHQRLKEMVDYFIDREVAENRLPKRQSNLARYKSLLDRISSDFALACARFEREYIFCWLDWDGDNILTDGSVIDYGSIRQFGLFHHAYRYDDIERFSTSLLEQKQKARKIVQTFAQMTDFLITRIRKPLSHFSTHPILEDFDSKFLLSRTKLLLQKMGLKADDIQTIVKKAPELVQKFENHFDVFERVTSTRGEIRIEDGVTANAIFAMRDFLREAPHKILQKNEWNADWFFRATFSSFATQKDRRLFKKKYRDRAEKLLRSYSDILESLAIQKEEKINQLVNDLTQAAWQNNPKERMTGDAILHVGNLIKARAKSIGPKKMNQLIDLVISNRQPDPLRKLQRVPDDLSKLIKKIEKLVLECRESI